MGTENYTSKEGIVPYITLESTIQEEGRRVY